MHIIKNTTINHELLNIPWPTDRKITTILTLEVTSKINNTIIKAKFLDIRYEILEAIFTFEEDHIYNRKYAFLRIKNFVKSNTHKTTDIEI